MAYYDSSNAVFERIEAYTIQLEQTPLEAYTSSARATFLKTLQAAANDMTWLVYEIRMSHKNLAEIKHLKLDNKYNLLNEAFIAKALAARNRFAACFPAVKDILLDGTHEIDNAMSNAKDHVAYIEEALGKI
jgi:hypothetical protein